MTISQHLQPAVNTDSRIALRVSFEYIRSDSQGSLAIVFRYSVSWMLLAVKDNVHMCSVCLPAFRVLMKTCGMNLLEII